jgi:L-arabinokinase
VFYVLLAEGELTELPAGADLLLYSTVPLGAGVASSAAIEVASMRAAAAAYGAPTAGLRLAALCQVVENQVVGAPCGIMDQVTCTLGRPGELLALKCQPHEVTGWHAPPPAYAFIGLDSGVKHAVGGQRYPVVRCAAFMGRAIIRERLQALGERPDRIDHLSNLAPAEFRAQFRDLLPARLSGRGFMARWGETGDPATTILPDQDYPVRGATEHPIYENDRVHRFMRHLAAAGSAERSQASGGRRARPAVDRAGDAMVAAGRLMYVSHRSYGRNCGLGSTETDLIVSLARAAGPSRGLFGAKITGGGSGGTVAVLVEADGAGAPSTRATDALGEIARVYQANVGREPRLIRGSRPGADSIAPAVIIW